ncbi:tail fiber domain-containing protein [Shewanella psychropiezotolerans]|uniref:Tail fiber domain-containing protein n=1 Tax=Shewanella psychropiezotolerans TaxID=2593655 RepID=A0ABX5WWQ2_9GAMM|nr:tail fiber domain-containing protein [Shewanella psychropiezotolerans]QDO83514.1 tail fiber domain-containing protein [Shewanella psychropiezotolerans]
MNKNMSISISTKKALTVLPLSLAFSLAMTATAHADQVILDDLIVDGSACIGFDCVNGESFGFDTLRLKENNLRIKFQDTSSSSSFPSNDWQITVNDSSNGGANKFSIDDIDSGKTPFTIEAGAPNHSLFVDDGGRLGLGTSTPVVDIHIKSGNTPTLRLEQDGSSGFTPQTWDVAGNEANFFVRDATNGSKLVFRIQPSAPSNSIFVASDGDIGLGDATPDAALDIESGDLMLTDGQVTIRKTNDPKILFNENDVVDQQWEIGIKDIYGNGLALLNNSPSKTFLGMVIQPDGDIYINNGTDMSNQLWSWHLDATTEAIHQSGDLFVGGDITAQGTISPGSSRTTKNNITMVDGDKILKLITDIDIYSWSYIKDAGKVTHIGPMAEEFYELFNYGVDNKHISPTDTSGISLAAIKAMMNKVESQNAKIAKLENVLIELQLQNKQH